jgi:hypothetical protein
VGAFVFAVAAAGCSDDPAGEGEPEAAGADPIAMLDAAMACGAQDLVACDVLDPACQQTLADIVACQWGGPGTASVLPPVNTFTSAEFLAQLTAASMAAPPVPAPVQQALAAALRWLGLAQPSAIGSQQTNELIASLYLAFYNFETKRATLIEDARTGDARVDDVLLFHELVHAQQDARYDLTTLASSAATTDNIIAFRSLVEGEAQFHQTLLDLALFDVPVNPTTVGQVIEFARTQEEAAWFEQPENAWQVSVALSGHLYGQYMVRDWWFEGGPAGMVAHFADPPTQSLRMLEAAFGREPATSGIWASPAANVFTAVGQALPMPGDETYPLAFDRLGAWTIYMLARLAGLAIDVAEDLALGWRGDQVDLFQLQAGGFAARFRVSFDTEANATEFERLLSAKENIEVRRNGTFVAAGLSEQPDKPDWLFGPLQSP